MKVCTEFGEGFFYIPGTDTCLRLSGELRAEYLAFGSNYWGAGTKDGDRYDFRTEARLKFDARTQTEYGLLRSYIQLNIYSGNTNRPGGDGNSFQGKVDKAFIQFGGLTAGFAHSFFGFYDNDYGDTIFAGYYAPQDTVNLVAYTATFGGGFSATLSIEDGGEHNNQFAQGVVITDPVTGAVIGQDAVVGTYGGKRIPDIVGQLRLDQEWGKVAVSAALHDTRFSDLETTKDHKLGWAVGGSVAVNLPFAAGAYVVLEGVYADGASDYLGRPGAAYDYGVNPFGSTDSGKGWSITGEAGVNVTPALQLIAFGSYVDYDNGDISGFGIGANNIPGIVVGDFKAWVAGANATYTVVPGLTVAGEVSYQSTKYDDVNGISFEDDNYWQGGIRIKRTF